MKNAYFLITLPASKSTARVQDLASRGLKAGLPHQTAHYRFNNDHSAAVMQAELTEEQFSLVKGLAYVTYLGDCVDGRADKAVLDYLSANRAEWESAT